MKSYLIQNTLMHSYFNSIIATITAVTKYVETKIFIAILMPIYAFLYNIDNSQLMLAILVLIIFDFITGIYASKESGEKIKSRKVIRSAFKLAVYGLLISAGHLTDFVVGITAASFNIEIAMIGFLAATELISILENAAKMNYPTPIKLLNTLKEYTKNK